MTGSAEGTRPSAGGAAAAAGSASGSASTEGAVVTDMTRQNARTAARRTTTAIGLTGDTVRTVRFKLRNLLVDPPRLLCVRNCYAIWVRNARGPVALVGVARNPTLASFTRPLELLLVGNRRSGAEDREGDDETSYVRSRTAGRSDQRHGSRGRHRRSARGFRPFCAAGARDNCSIADADSSIVCGSGR